MKKNWNHNHIPDLRGKVMIIAGADNTLGYETAATFAKNGGEAILACHNITIGERIKEKILKSQPRGIVTVMSLDLKDAASIKEFGKTFTEKYDRLDVLMNINDFHMIPGHESAQVFGKPFGNDHAGHFILTTVLVKTLTGTPYSRVVNMSLGEHKLKARDFQRLMESKGSQDQKKQKIGKSKWANLLFTYELQRFFDSQQVNCKALAAYSGPSNRNLERSMKNKWYWRIFKPVYRMFTGPDPSQSALPGIQAALASDVKGGEYYGPGGLVDSKGYSSYNAVLKFVA